MDQPLPHRHDRLDATAVLILVLCCALWGVQQVSVKVAIAGGIPPILQSGLRSLGAALLVCAWTWARGGGAAMATLIRRDRSLPSGLLVALMFAAEFAILYPGLQLTTASRGVVFLYTAPFFTAVGAHLFLTGERLSPVRALGLTIAFAGVAVSFADGLARGGGNVKGDLLCVLAAALWGATTVVLKGSNSLHRVSHAKVLLYQLGFSAPLLLALSGAWGEWSSWPVASALAWAALLYQTLIVAFASYLAWFWLLQRYPAGRLSSFTFLTPVYGLIAGILFLGEPATPALLLGLGAVALGLRLVNARGRVSRRPR